MIGLEWKVLVLFDYARLKYLFIHTDRHKR